MKYCCAAIMILRILLVKLLGRVMYVISLPRVRIGKRLTGESNRFAQADVHDFAKGLFDALLTKIEAGVKPEGRRERLLDEG
jgi:hypothetical protein